jgi:hypothetical protein
MKHRVINPSIKLNIRSNPPSIAHPSLLFCLALPIILAWKLSSSFPHRQRNIIFPSLQDPAMHMPMHTPPPFSILPPSTQQITASIICLLISCASSPHNRNQGATQKILTRTTRILLTHSFFEKREETLSEASHRFLHTQSWIES